MSNQRKATCDKDSLPAFWKCDWIIVEGRIDGRTALRFGISESAQKFTYPPSLNISHGLCWQNVQPTPIVAPKCWKSAQTNAGPDERTHTALTDLIPSPDIFCIPQNLPFVIIKEMAPLAPSQEIGTLGLRVVCAHLCQCGEILQLQKRSRLE